MILSKKLVNIILSEGISHLFYEFKPKDAPIGQGRNLLTLDQLEIGRSYELVITTLSGFYRYQTQKTFLVVGRYHDTPTVLIDKD